MEERYEWSRDTIPDKDLEAMLEQELPKRKQPGNDFKLHEVLFGDAPGEWIVVRRRNVAAA